MAGYWSGLIAGSATALLGAAAASLLVEGPRAIPPEAAPLEVPAGTGFEGARDDVPPAALPGAEAPAAGALAEAPRTPDPAAPADVPDPGGSAEMPRTGAPEGSLSAPGEAPGASGVALAPDAPVVPGGSGSGALVAPGAEGTPPVPDMAGTPAPQVAGGIEAPAAPQPSGTGEAAPELAAGTGDDPIAAGSVIAALDAPAADTGPEALTAPPRGAAVPAPAEVPSMTAPALADSAGVTATAGGDAPVALAPSDVPEPEPRDQAARMPEPPAPPLRAAPAPASEAPMAAAEEPAANVPAGTDAPVTAAAEGAALSQPGPAPDAPEAQPSPPPEDTPQQELADGGGAMETVLEPPAAENTRPRVLIPGINEVRPELDDSLPGRPGRLIVGETRPGSLQAQGGGVVTNRLPTVLDPAGSGSALAGQEAAPEPARGNALQDNRVDFEDPEGRPVMSVVLLDDGTRPLGPEALAALPFQVSIAVTGATSEATARMAAWRGAGLEVLAVADLPEGAQPADAETVLSAVTSAVPEAVAVLEGAGAPLQGDRALAAQAIDILAASGHGLVLRGEGLGGTARTANGEGVPAVEIYRDIDGEGQDERAMRRFLDGAAFRARQAGGGVIVLARLRPDTISALTLWGYQARAGQVALAPVSQVLSPQQPSAAGSAPGN